MKQAKIMTVEEEELEHLSTLISQINAQVGSQFDSNVTSKSLLQIKDIYTTLKNK